MRVEFWRMENGVARRLCEVWPQDGDLLEDAIKDLAAEVAGVGDREGGKAVRIVAIDFDEYERWVRLRDAPPLDENDINRKFSNSMAASKYIGAPGNQVSNAMRRSDGAKFTVRGVTFFREK